MSPHAALAPPTATRPAAGSRPAQPAASAWPFLDSLPGVAPALRDAMRRHFRTDAALRKAVAELDVAALEAVPGLSGRKALDLLRGVQGSESLDTLCATASARKVVEAVLERLESFASTPQGRSRLRLTLPQPDPASATARIRHALAWKEQAAALDREAVRRLLRGVRLPTDPTPRLATERLVVCLDPDEEKRLRALGAGAWVQVTGREGLEQASQYPVVLVAGDEQVDAEEAIDLPMGCGLADVAPEAVLAWFHHNRDLLRAQAALAALLGRPSRAEEALRLAEAARRSETTPADLHAAVEAVRKEAEARLRERVAALSLRGDEILLALGSRLPPALDAILKETIAHAHRELRSRTGCDLQPLRAGFPLTVDEQEVARAERELEGSGRRQAFQAQVRAARQLQPLVADLTQEARFWLGFDADFALGCFALAHDLREPVFGDRLSLRDSIHLDLADPAAIADGRHQAITYELGGPHPVAVLTGANSGGKTTLLEHVCQVVAMARLGLPVVGDAVVPWVDEVHYVTARKGLDAGAFEAFLRTFLPVLQGSRRRLVLADEVEAVTELESAGRILGFFADRAARAGIPTILVTHMAPQILQHAAEAASGRIRVDGIEATGLDEQHRLIVDRVPRMGHFARSTPELIVQRLAATTRGAEGELFAELAQALASGSRGAPAPGLPPEPSLGTPSQAAGMAEGAIHTQAAARRRPRATV